jgi:hypothetical protein
MVESSAVQHLLTSWWFDYDQGNFEAWPDYFAADARFSCRSDSGKTDFEEFVTADVSGKDAVLEWQIDHRRNSPYPLRHNGTNIHVSSSSGREADFRSYIFVTQIVGGAVSNLSSGIVLGSVREEDGRLRFTDMRVILDFTESELFDLAPRTQPA